MRRTKPIFHVFFEGKTEKSYYVSLANKYNITLKPHHNNSKAAAAILLKDAIKHKKSQKNNAVVSPQVFYWLVFDEDQNPDTQLVILQAKKSGISCAYSNPCFELWLLLHFIKNPPRGLSAQKMCDELKKNDVNYDANGRKSIRFDNYFPHIEAAIQNVKTLDNLFENPSTNNHVLVEALQKLSK
jgi:hypothetical protein